MVNLIKNILKKLNLKKKNSIKIGNNFTKIKKKIKIS